MRYNHPIVHRKASLRCRARRPTADGVEVRFRPFQVRGIYRMTSTLSRAIEQWRAVEAEFGGLSLAELEQMQDDFRRRSQQMAEMSAGYVEVLDARVCSKCGIRKPLDQFKRRSVAQGRTPSWCKPCVAASDRARRQRKRAAVTRELGRHIKSGTPAEKTRLVMASLVQRLGGVEAVAAALVRLWNEGMESKSHRDRWAAAALLFRIVQAAE
jgi:hypothetical protein